MQTLDFVSGLHNCLEFAQPLSCLYHAMQTRSGEYKAEKITVVNWVLFHSKNVLKIQEYPSVDDFEGKKRLHAV